MTQAVRHMGVHYRRGQPFDDRAGHHPAASRNTRRCRTRPIAHDLPPWLGEAGRPLHGLTDYDAAGPTRVSCDPSETSSRCATGLVSTGDPGRHNALVATDTAVAFPTSPRPGGLRIATGTIGVMAGAAAVLVGVATPWVTVLHGREQVNGVGGDGAYMVAGAIGAGALWTAYLLAGRPRQLRALTALAGILIAYWAFFDAWRLVALTADSASAETLGAPTLGIGSIIVGVGGIMVMASTLSVPARTGRVAWPAWWRLALAGALLATAAIHLQQTPEHLELSTVLGLGFAGAALSQFVLSALVLVRGSRLLYGAIIADCAIFFAIYVYAVLHGLPFPAHDDAGLRLGAGEPVTLSGAVSKAAEAVAMGIALPLGIFSPRR